MNISILPGAGEELRDAAAYYESEQAGLGGRFLDTFDAAMQEIIAAPDMYSPIGGHYRKYGLRPYPYAVIYRQYANTIVIVAVMHQKLRPNYWRVRE